VDNATQLEVIEIAKHENDQLIGITEENIDSILKYAQEEKMLMTSGKKKLLFLTQLLVTVQCPR
jgi:endonuclease III-like uncharacterized protein